MITATAAIATRPNAMSAAMFGLTVNAPIAPGAWLTMPAKMMKLMPLPMPRSVMSSPTHIRATAPAVSVAIWVRVSKLPRSNRPVRTLLRVEEGQEAVRLEHRHRDGQVARVLGDPVAPVLALAAEGLERGHDALHQLHDDRRVDVRVHAEGHDREVRQATAGEQVQEPEQRVALQEGGELRPIDARHRHGGQEPEDDQQAQDDTGSGAGCPALGRRSAAIRTRGPSDRRIRRRPSRSTRHRRRSLRYRCRSPRRRRSHRRRPSPARQRRPRPARPRPRRCRHLGLGSLRRSGARLRVAPWTPPRWRGSAAARGLGGRLETDRLDRLRRDLEDRHGAAGGLDLRPRRAGERVGHDEQRRRQLTRAQDLERLVQAPDQPDGAQDVLVDGDLGVRLGRALRGRRQPRPRAPRARPPRRWPRR